MAPPSSIVGWPPPSAYDEIVTIIVGQDPAKVYSVHKGVLTFYSGYFNKALNGGFAEPASKKITLQDADSRVFDTVQNWLYSHQLHPAGERELKKVLHLEISKVWIFGDAHDMPALQNAAITLAHEAILEQCTVPVPSLNYVYDNTCPGAKLRMYYADIISKTSSAANALTTSHQENYTKEALVDILKVVWKSSHTTEGKEQVRKWDMCTYHVHDDGVKCTKKTA